MTSTLKVHSIKGRENKTLLQEQELAYCKKYPSSRLKGDQFNFGLDENGPPPFLPVKLVLLQ